jgi:hypothetical protein
MLNLLVKAKIYTKLDVEEAYDILRLEERDKYTLGFRTRYGLYEPIVMQFCTTYATVDFERYINNAKREALENFASS